MYSEPFVKRIYLLVDPDSGEVGYGRFNYYPITEKMQFIKPCPPCLKPDPNKMKTQYMDNFTFYYWDGVE